MDGALEILIAKGRRSSTAGSDTRSPVRGFTSGGNSVIVDTSNVGVGDATDVAVGGGKVEGEVGESVAAASAFGVRVGVGVTALALPPQATKKS